MIHGPKEHPHAVGDRTSVVPLRVDGMSCSACADRVQKALSSVPGVVSAEVNLNRRFAFMHLAEGAERDAVETAAVAAVVKAGYRASVLIESS